MASRVLGPIPFTRIRSSGDENGRAFRIRSAFTGPIPLSFWSSASDARLTLIFCPGAMREEDWVVDRAELREEVCAAVPVEGLLPE